MLQVHYLFFFKYIHIRTCLYYRFAFLIENTYALCFLLVMGLNLTVIVFTAVVVSMLEKYEKRTLPYSRFHMFLLFVDHYKSRRYETNDKIDATVWRFFFSPVFQLCSWPKGPRQKHQHH